MKAVARVLRAERPCVSGLMTGMAGAPVGSEILEKSVLRSFRRATRLESRDSAAGIGIHLEFPNNRRRLLRVCANIRKEPPHFLGVRDCPGACGGAIGEPNLRGCKIRSTDHQSH